MLQTLKAGKWYFGMKAHIGVDSATGPDPQRQRDSGQ